LSATVLASWANFQHILPQGSPGKLNDSEVRCGTQLITLSVRGEYQTLFKRSIDGVDVISYCPKCHQLVSPDQLEQTPGFLGSRKRRSRRSIQLRPCKKNAAF
jgi:hypothetical protein